MGLLVGGGGCYGGLSVGEDGAADGSASGGTDSSGEDGDGDDGDDEGVGADEDPAPTTRFARLTHAQWENTVADLLYLSAATGFSDAFRADAAQSGFIFDNNAAALEVDQALWSGYQRAAADAAELVANDQTILDAILPPDGGDDAVRRDAFVQEFGLRAFRRPLSESEAQSYSTLFDTGDAMYSDSTGFAAGVRLVIETLFQSPHFLYRVEWSTTDDDGVIPLDDYEVASRMSYFLWHSMPDDELFASADAGMLSSRTNVQEQAQRMLADPRAREVVKLFHAQLHETQKFQGASPSPTFYPDAPEDLGLIAQEEHDRFIEHIVFEQAAGLTALFTSTETFVNDELAALYQLEGTYGAEYELAQLDPTKRKGVFTQIGFLAANAASVQPDPIHRGVFLVERMTCSDLPAPPDGVPPLPPPEGKTNRQTVIEHTMAPGTDCVGCHTIINAYGFPFENYDSVGAWRDLDTDMPVDASADPLLDGETIHVENALELIDALAVSPAVHECYVEHWVQYANGRPAAEQDDTIVTRLGDTSLTDASVQDLLVEIASSRPFRNRATEDLQ